MVGSVCFLIMILVAYLDKNLGGMGWIIAVPGFLLMLIVYGGFIASIVFFFVSLSKKEQLNIIKQKILYGSIILFIVIFVVFIRVMRATGNG